MITPEGERSPDDSLGLGLYIVVKVAEAHGGEVDVTSGDEDGTTFTMRLPKQDGDDDDRRSAIDTHPAVTSCSEFDD